MRDDNIIVIGNTLAGRTDKAILREIRGSLWEKLDYRFAIILLLSVIIHGIILFRVNTIKLKPVEVTSIEKMPERLAKLIVEKPVPKEEVQKKLSDQKTAKTTDVEKTETAVLKTPGAKKAMDRKVAKKAVAPIINMSISLSPCQKITAGIMNMVNTIAMVFIIKKTVMR